MKNLDIMFLPSNKIEMFLAMETPMAKLRYAVKALAESHGGLEYNLENLEYLPERADVAEPFATIYGHNVPLLMDCHMLAEYLNGIDPNAFYIEDSAFWGSICICYTPMKAAIDYVRSHVDMDEVRLAIKKMDEQREPLFRVNSQLSDSIYDLMEEYGQDHDLPENWWLSEHDEESILFEL